MDAFVSDSKASGFLLEVGHQKGPAGLQKKLIAAGGSLKQDVIHRLSMMAKDLQAVHEALGPVGDAFDILMEACVEGAYDDPEECDGLDGELFSALQGAAAPISHIYNNAKKPSSTWEKVLRAAVEDFKAVLATQEDMFTLPGELGVEITDAWKKDQQEKCPELWAAALSKTRARASAQEKFMAGRLDYKRQYGLIAAMRATAGKGLHGGDLAEAPSTAVKTKAAKVKVPVDEGKLSKLKAEWLAVRAENMALFKKVRQMTHDAQGLGEEEMDAFLV